jgi:predicted SAM-dependent methyltransferase
VGGLLRLFYRPALPKLPDGEVRLHLGCGKIDHPGFINIDAIPRRHVHYAQPVDNLRRFGDGSVDFIYACHVLEHFSHLRVPAVLAEWRRVLKSGGRLCLSVPDFDLLCTIYRENGNDMRVIQNALLGGQEYPYNFHRVAFNFDYLTGLLQQSGFARVSRWTPDDDERHQVNDWSRRPLIVAGRSYPVSLNIEAEK